ncbi:MAG: ribose 5-phosphate isomerase B [Flavobacteriales bacterium]|jgi:ribose 5-phosphate isomerase B|nr:ribose 5-phosphate isomerase B [Flavobacteriales bacterium]
MKIIIGSDHAGVSYKKAIVALLESKGINVQDIGPFTENSVHYPEYAHAVAFELLHTDEESLGIVLCGSGNGINMTVNKHQAVRSALCWNAEIASLARQHNDANILSLPARFVSEKEALEIVEAFLAAEFEGGRHATRVDMIPIQDIEIDE